MATPAHGDRILVLLPHWLNLILNGDKTLEIRSRKLRAGRYFLGCGGNIYASAQLAAPFAIEDVAQWIALRGDHCVQYSDALPYQRTYGSPIRELQLLENPVPYRRKRGAIGIVRYEAPSA